MATPDHTSPVLARNLHGDEVEIIVYGHSCLVFMSRSDGYSLCLSPHAAAELSVQLIDALAKAFPCAPRPFSGRF